MKIQIEIKHCYGLEQCYPHCITAKLFARIAQTRTLTRESLRCIRALGYEVEIIDTRAKALAQEIERGGDEGLSH